MTTPVRMLAAAATFVFTFVAGMATASADAPISDDWPKPEPTSTLDTLLIFGGGTVGLFVLITLLGMLLSRNNYVPPPPSKDIETHSGH